MAMASLNISLPQSLKDYVEGQVSQGGCSTPSECLRQLVRQDQKRRAEERLESLLLEGLNSGTPIEINWNWSSPIGIETAIEQGREIPNCTWC